jgi:type I restriction enzyme, S subunit
MSSDTRVPLSSVAEIVSVKVPVSSLGGHPYVSTENLLPNLGGLGEGELPDADRVNSFNKHDTLFSNIRPYFRKVHYAPTEGGCSADVLVFRTKNAKEFWPPYLYYCLADPTFIEHTMATCKGAKMPRGDKGAMLQYLVHKPDLDAQKKVSSLLRNIDESVSALQHQNTALGAIAQRLFRSWFVNFDPVHAKAAGKEPEAMSPELAALFPSEFEDSELGPIPKGWSVTTFGDAFDIKGGATPSTSEPLYWEGGTHAWATPKDMSSLASKVIYRTERQITAAGVAKISSKALPAGTVLMSSRAPVGYLAIAKAPISINQGFIAIPPTPGIPASFALELLAHKMPDIKANAGGTTFAEISKTQFRPIKWIRPSGKVLAAFGKLVEPLFAQVHGNCLLVDSLADLRDHLLPRLISGKLSLEEAQQVVEEATAA